MPDHVDASSKPKVDGEGWTCTLIVHPADRAGFLTKRETHHMDLQKLRADIEAAKLVAMKNFASHWGTSDPREVFEALRTTVPQSKSWAEAARSARRATLAR